MRGIAPSRGGLRGNSGASGRGRPRGRGSEGAAYSRPDGCEASCGFGTPLRALRGGGFAVTEARYVPAARIPPHETEHASLCLALEGGYWEERRGTRLHCEPATLMFHPRGDLHASLVSEAGSRCLNVVMEEAFLAALPDGTASRLDGGAGRRVLPRWQAFGLLAALRPGDETAALEAEELLLLLLSDVARLPGMEVPRAPPAWLERVRERIHDGFGERLGLAELAATAGVHRVHLARAFRKHYGCTVGEYIRQRRVEFACRELTATGTSLGRIAFRAGFADQSHFTHTFRRLVGLTPGAFRARASA